MGAWGVLAFDNDSANDWAYGLDRAKDISLVESAFGDVEQVADGYLEVDLACNALAACEVLARLQGRSGYKNSYTEKVDVWVAAHKIAPSPQIIARADAVIDRILAEKSELRELWDEGDATDWLNAVEDLRKRLRP